MYMRSKVGGDNGVGHTVLSICVTRFIDRFSSSEDSQHRIPAWSETAALVSLLSTSQMFLCIQVTPGPVKIQQNWGPREVLHFQQTPRGCRGRQSADHILSTEVSADTAALRLKHPSSLPGFRSAVHMHCVIASWKSDCWEKKICFEKPAMQLQDPRRQPSLTEPVPPYDC